jgi:hypothetical protein
VRTARNAATTYSIMVRHTHAGDQLITRALAVECPAPGQRRPLVVSGAPRLRSNSGSLAMLAAMRRASSGGVAALLATHQPQELGFVNVAVFDEAGD